MRQIAAALAVLAVLVAVLAVSSWRAGDGQPATSRGPADAPAPGSGPATPIEPRPTPPASTTSGPAARTMPVAPDAGSAAPLQPPVDRPASNATAAPRDCLQPVDAAAAVACEAAATRALQRYESTSRAYRERLGPDEQARYDAAESALQLYVLARCQFESQRAGREGAPLSRANSQCVLREFAQRTTALEKLGATLADYSRVPEPSPYLAELLENSERVLEHYVTEYQRALATAAPEAPGEVSAAARFGEVQAQWNRYREAECAARSAVLAAQFGTAGDTRKFCLAELLSQRIDEVQALADALRAD